MIKAELGKEIVVKVRNAMGTLAEVAKTIGEKGVSILAVSGWVEGPDALLHLVTDDNLRAAEALKKHALPAQEAKVVIATVAHKPGMLKNIAEGLKVAQIDIHHLYASAPSDAPRCLLVFSCSDNDRAVVELNKLR